MSEPKNPDQKIIDQLMQSPESEQILNIAKDITDIVYGVRVSFAFTGIINPDDIEGPIQNRLSDLITDFRKLAVLVVETVLPETEEDLYIQVISPLIIQQLDASR